MTRVEKILEILCDAEEAQETHRKEGKFLPMSNALLAALVAELRNHGEPTEFRMPKFYSEPDGAPEEVSIN